MITPQTLGRRIKYFRKRAKFSQLDLELEAGLASGAISRIEKGRVNASKESVMKIARVLGMNHREVDYLIGVTAETASEEEIEAARDEVRDYFGSSGCLAYLLDDRSRIQLVSTKFKKILKISENELEIMYGKSVIELLINPALPSYKFFDNDNRIDQLKNIFPRFYSEFGFMEDDESIFKVFSLMSKDPGYKKMLLEAKFKILGYTPPVKEVIEFKILGFKLSMKYVRDHLNRNPRFYTVVYIPDNKVIRMLQRLI